MNECNEGLPIAIYLNAAELQQRLSAFLDPTHSSAVKAFGDDVVDRSLNRPRRDLQILLAQFPVIHLIHTLVEIVSHFLQAFLGALLSTSMRKFAPTLNGRVEVYLGQEVEGARTKAQVPNRINNGRRTRTAETGKLANSALREGNSGAPSSGCSRPSGVEQSADCRGGWLYTPQCAEMATTLGRDAEYRGLATAGRPPAFFPLRCAHRPRLWLAAVHGKRACPWRDGATPRLRDG
jgi:hypothetical protein